MSTEKMGKGKGIGKFGIYGRRGMGGSGRQGRGRGRGRFGRKRQNFIREERKYYEVEWKAL